jgi:hypothetical protein
MTAGVLTAAALPNQPSIAADARLVGEGTATAGTIAAARFQLAAALVSAMW